MKLFGKHEKPETPKAQGNHNWRSRHVQMKPWRIRWDAIVDHDDVHVLSLKAANRLMKLVPAYRFDELTTQYATMSEAAEAIGLPKTSLSRLRSIYAGRVTNAIIQGGKLVEVTQPTETHVKVEEPRTITLPVEEVARGVAELDDHIHVTLAAAFRTLADLLDPEKKP